LRQRDAVADRTAHRHLRATTLRGPGACGPAIYPGWDQGWWRLAPPFGLRV